MGQLLKIPNFPRFRHFLLLVRACSDGLMFGYAYVTSKIQYLMVFSLWVRICFESWSTLVAFLCVPRFKPQVRHLQHYLYGIGVREQTL